MDDAQEDATGEPLATGADARSTGRLVAASIGLSLPMQLAAAAFLTVGLDHLMGGAEPILVLAWLGVFAVGVGAGLLLLPVRQIYSDGMLPAAWLGIDLRAADTLSKDKIREYGKALYRGNAQKIAAYYQALGSMDRSDEGRSSPEGTVGPAEPFRSSQRVRLILSWGTAFSGIAGVIALRFLAPEVYAAIPRPVPFLVSVATWIAGILMLEVLHHRRWVDWYLDEVRGDRDAG